MAHEDLLVQRLHLRPFLVIELQLLDKGAELFLHPDIMVDVVRQKGKIGGKQQGGQYARQKQRLDLPHHGKMDTVLLPEPQARFRLQHGQDFFPEAPRTKPDKGKDDNDQEMDRGCFIQRVIENGTERYIYEYRIAIQQPALHKIDAGEQTASPEKARLDAVRRLAVELLVIGDPAFIQKIVRSPGGRDHDLARGVLNNVQSARNSIRNTRKVHAVNVGVFCPLDEQPSILQTGRIIDQLAIRQHSERFEHARLALVQGKRLGLFCGDDIALVGEVVEIVGLPVVFAGFECLHGYPEIVEKRLRQLRVHDGFHVPELYKGIAQTALKGDEASQRVHGVAQRRVSGIPFDHILLIGEKAHGENEGQDQQDRKESGESFFPPGHFTGFLCFGGRGSIFPLHICLYPCQKMVALGINWRQYT